MQQEQLRQKKQKWLEAITRPDADDDEVTRLDSIVCHQQHTDILERVYYIERRLLRQSTLHAHLQRQQVQIHEQQFIRLQQEHAQNHSDLQQQQQQEHQRQQQRQDHQQQQQQLPTVALCASGLPHDVSTYFDASPAVTSAIVSAMTSMTRSDCVEYSNLVNKFEAAVLQQIAYANKVMPGLAEMKTLLGEHARTDDMVDKYIQRLQVRRNTIFCT